MNIENFKANHLLISYSYFDIDVVVVWIYDEVSNRLLGTLRAKGPHTEFRTNSFRNAIRQIKICLKLKNQKIIRVNKVFCYNRYGLTYTGPLFKVVKYGK